MRRFLFIYAGMTVVAAVLAARTGCPSLFALPRGRLELAGSVVLAVLLAALVVRGGIALERRPWYRAMAAFLKRMLTSRDVLGPEIDGERAFVVALYSSIGEEALFRGFVQPVLVGWAAGALGSEPDSALALSLGVLGSSLVFGLLHFPLVPELRPWTGFAIGLGLAFGALAAWSGSLLGPVLAHLLINWLNLWRLGRLDLEAP